jgi:hypothetical protein
MIEKLMIDDLNLAANPQSAIRNPQSAIVSRISALPLSLSLL